MDKDSLETIQGIFYMGVVALFAWGVFGLLTNVIA